MVPLFQSRGYAEVDAHAVGEDGLAVEELADAGGVGDGVEDGDDAAEGLERGEGVEVGLGADGVAY